MAVKRSCPLARCPSSAVGPAPQCISWVSCQGLTQSLLCVHCIQFQNYGLTHLHHHGLSVLYSRHHNLVQARYGRPLAGSSGATSKDANCLHCLQKCALRPTLWPGATRHWMLMQQATTSGCLPSACSSSSVCSRAGGVQSPHDRSNVCMCALILPPLTEVQPGVQSGQGAPACPHRNHTPIQPSASAGAAGCAARAGA